ncbi:hypothetical protein [Niemeyer virus]|uniref:F-box protein n=1 Tax=Acanthamoeba polyphaga mimivirus Kroon TaxID=3069720 RepID=A0A0G2Y5P0_9VIRU|nr:hypothetical protein QJ850_gp800 [Acanthamoeba polyphaga mimivirus]AKI79899.1 hypothetical protein [Acanthamoeba polyphaga mimivirus Kroon]ALR83732.1 hypothetical protein [Niemeyer virus]
MDNINCLFSELLVIIINLLSDLDKIKFMTTCSRLYYFIDKIHYINIYDYNKICHLNFIDRFKRIRFHAVNSDSIPSIVTDLILDNNFTGSLKTCNLSKLLYIKLNFHQYKKNRNYISSNVKIDCSNSVPPTRRNITFTPTRRNITFRPIGFVSVNRPIYTEPFVLPKPYSINQIQISWKQDYGYRDINFTDQLDDPEKIFKDIDESIMKNYKKFLWEKSPKPTYIPIVSRNPESSHQSKPNEFNGSIKSNEFNKSDKSAKTNTNNIHNIVAPINSNKNFHKNKYKYQNRIIPKHSKLPKKFSKNKYH